MEDYDYIIDEKLLSIIDKIDIDTAGKIIDNLEPKAKKIIDRFAQHVYTNMTENNYVVKTDKTIPDSEIVRTISGPFYKIFVLLHEGFKLALLEMEEQPDIISPGLGTDKDKNSLFKTGKLSDNAYTSRESKETFHAAKKHEKYKDIVAKKASVIRERLVSITDELNEDN